ncbi:MAG: hypothetical protein K6F94_01905 [Bacteroidaceae bacterium]|nr:hypothetical protein [Bacteroidaceae bacterium]
MRKAKFVILWVFALLIVACESYDDFTADRAATLSFSTDSVRFDTLISTVPSATKTLIVYNHGDKGIRISQVALGRGADSHFRVNVDGQDMSLSAENCVYDFEVRRRDSIFVRIEVTVPELDSDDIQQLEDVLVFTLESGVRHRIVLTAGGQNAYFLRGKIIRNDTTFATNLPIVVYDSLVVEQGSELTLKPGTQLLFHEGAYLRVKGKLTACGTLDSAVVFRGDRTDHMFDYLPYDRLPARWEGIEIDAGSRDNRMEYVDIHSAKYGIVCRGNSDELSSFTLTDTIQSPHITVVNSRLHNIGGMGIDCHDAVIVVQNSEVSNTLGNCVNLIGGVSQFTHCTLAQFYPLDAQRGNALFFTDSIAASPIRLCDFNNCVIVGYAEDELMGDVNLEGPTAANFHFRNCYIATVETDMPERFIGVVYDKYDEETHPISGSDNFILVDTHNFLYDFTPKDSSMIRGTADPLLSRPLPTDRLGRNRFADGAPDAGCYEFILTENK